MQVPNDVFSVVPKIVFANALAGLCFQKRPENYSRGRFARSDINIKNVQPHAGNKRLVGRLDVVDAASTSK